MPKNAYFPVGRELTTEQLRAYDWVDMQHRKLSDPRFAGCEANFNWRNYIELQFDDKTLEREVSQTLDQFGKTPEGQQTIRQAFAMQNYRIRSGQTDYARDQEGKLYITDQTNAAQTLFSPNINGISVYKEDAQKHSLQAVDGYYYHQSLAAQLYHELCHAKDGFDTQTQHDRFFFGVKLAEVKRDNAMVAAAADPKAAKKPIAEKNGSVYEYPAILETNAFMHKYYGEVPRALQHNAVRENTWFNEHFGRTWPQPNLPQGIDYNHIPNASAVPNCKPSPKAQKR